MFQPGQSGNPGGRPKGEARIKEAAREHGEAALAVLVDALQDSDRRIAMKAAELLLDRGFGKPSQAIVGDADADPIQQSIRVLFGRD